MISCCCGGVAAGGLAARVDEAAGAAAADDDPDRSNRPAPTCRLSIAALCWLEISDEGFDTGPSLVLLLLLPLPSVSSESLGVSNLMMLHLGDRLPFSRGVFPPASPTSPSPSALTVADKFTSAKASAWAGATVLSNPLNRALGKGFVGESSTANSRGTLMAWQ